MVKTTHVGRPHGKSLARVRQRSPLLVGTDCSGIETPLIALKNLKVPMRHVFSCDNDPHVKKVILANFKPEVFFDDLTQRKLHNNTCLEKPLDLYVAGFPCQPFSAAGVHGGTSDPRGLIIVHILRFIQKHTPRTFLLENVKGLVSKKHRETFLAIMRCLCPDVSKCIDCHLTLAFASCCSLVCLRFQLAGNYVASMTSRTTSTPRFSVHQTMGSRTTALVCSLLAS